MYEMYFSDQWAQIARFMCELVLAQKTRDLLYGSKAFIN